jgi:hypothetical protein
MARYAAGDYFDVTSKDTSSVEGCSSGWLGILPAGEKCGAAKGQQALFEVHNQDVLHVIRSLSFNDERSLRSQ